MKLEKINDELTSALNCIVKGNSDILDDARKVFGEMNAVFSISSKAEVERGPLAGHVVKLELHIDPDEAYDS